MAGLLAAIVAVPAAAYQPGEVIWRFQIPASSPGQHVGVGSDGRVYTTSFTPGNLYAITPRGTLVWSLEIGLASGHWPIVFAADGTIYTGAIGVRAVNPNGTLRWAFDSGSWLVSGPGVGPDGNVYAVDDAAVAGLGFFSLGPDGGVRWSTLESPLPNALSHPSDQIVFGDGFLVGGLSPTRSGPWVTSYAFDLDGQQLWSRWYTASGGPSSNPRMLPDGRILCRWGPGSLATLRRDGTEDWVRPHPQGAQVLLPPAVGPDGVIYSGDAHGVQLWAANPDGSTRWVGPETLQDGLGALGVSPDNRVLVASGWTPAPDGFSDGWIRGYNPANGSLLWQLDLGREQGRNQGSHMVRLAFSSDGEAVYLTTSFSGGNVPYSYLYAIALRAGTVGVPTDDRGRGGTPAISSLPNPCFGAATIRLSRAAEGPASVTVHDLTGRVVRRFHEDPVAGGGLSFRWDLRDDERRAVAPGVYVVSLRTARGTCSTRVVVMR